MNGQREKMRGRGTLAPRRAINSKSTQSKIQCNLHYHMVLAELCESALDTLSSRDMHTRYHKYKYFLAFWRNFLWSPQTKPGPLRVSELKSLHSARARLHRPDVLSKSNQHYGSIIIIIVYYAKRQHRTLKHNTRL